MSFPNLLLPTSPHPTPNLANSALPGTKLYAVPSGSPHFAPSPRANAALRLRVLPGPGRGPVGGGGLTWSLGPLWAKRGPWSVSSFPSNSPIF